MSNIALLTSSGVGDPAMLLSLSRNKLLPDQGDSLLQGIETRRLIARGVAQQWFGGLMRPATAADGWLLEGLAGWAEDHFLRTFMGANELAYRSGPLCP